MSQGESATRADVTRARLLSAAVDAFSAKGFHGTSTRDIAAAAGMSPAAVYVHHKSKEELLHLISTSGHQVTLDIVRSARETSDDAVTQLRTFARDFAAHHARSHVVARVVNYELAALTPEHYAEVREIRRAIAADVRQLIADGVGAGVFRSTDPAMTATALLSLGVDIARWYREEGVWTPDAVGDFYAGLALRMVGVDPA